MDIITTLRISTGNSTPPARRSPHSPHRCTAGTSSTGRPGSSRAGSRATTAGRCACPRSASTTTRWLRCARGCSTRGSRRAWTRSGNSSSGVIPPDRPAVSLHRRSKPMAALSSETGTLKFVHTYGAGLHSGDADPDVHDPRWQRRQVDDFVEFAVLAEELGFDGITVTEHHAPLMVCPSPHLLLAAAAVRTSRIRLGTAVTVLPLYTPLRVAEEAGTLDLLSGGRFELGLGRGIPGEAQIAAGRNLSDDDVKRAWLEGLEVVNLALTERDFTFDGEFYPV